MLKLWSLASLQKSPAKTPNPLSYMGRELRMENSIQK